MHLRTLGGLTIEGADFGRPKPLLLLTYLAVEGPQDRRHMAELFWRSAKDPMASLRVALTRLRAAAPDALQDDEHRISTDVDCDASALLTSLEEGGSGSLELYGGAFLDGFHLRDLGSELEEWIYGTREFLAERMRTALLVRAETLAADGRPAGAAEMAERALEVAGAGPAEPEQLERIHRLLRAGNSPRAREVADELREYGVAPTAPHAAGAAPPRSSDLAAPREVPNNLVLPITSFIGRHQELRSIGEQLADDQERLITLLGTAGVGKTRLSIEAARRALDSGRFPDGVYWVGLDALTEVEQIGYRIADAIGLALQGPDPATEQLARFLARRRTLLVLDNYEQLIEGALIPHELVTACPGLTIVVTSRERLGVSGERIIRVEGLDFPRNDAGIDPAAAGLADAVRLFTLRAQRADPDFRLDVVTVPEVLRICEIVEGAPLGLELAASWAGALLVGDIAAELSAGLDGLTVRAKDVPERHRSLEAAFERSWALLSEREREVLRRLSVFRGGFRREAASQVVGATLPLLAGLVDKSLLRLAPNGRYDRHPLLFQFTHAKLARDPDELREYRERHGRYLRDLGPSLHELVETDVSAAALKRAKEELANLHAAWEFYIETGDAESMAAMADFVGYFTEVWGRLREGRALLERGLQVLSRDDAISELARGRLQGPLGVTLWRFGEFKEGVRLATQAITTLEGLEPIGERIGQWWASQAAGLNSFSWGHVREAVASFRHAYEVADGDCEDNSNAFLARRADGHAGLSANMLAMSDILTGDLESAKHWAAESYPRMYRSVPRFATYANEPRTLIALVEGRFADAEQWAREGLAHAERVGHDVVLVPQRANLARALWHQARFEEAVQVSQVALEQADLNGDRNYGTQARAILGRTLVRLGRLGDARPYLLRALEDAHAIGAVPYALDDALMGLAEIAESAGETGLAGRIAGGLAALASAQPIVRQEAQAMLDRLPGDRRDESGAGDLDVAGLIDKVPSRLR